MTTASTSAPVAFVLSGGASLGAIQVGRLRRRRGPRRSRSDALAELPPTG